MKIDPNVVQLLKSLGSAKKQATDAQVERHAQVASTFMKNTDNISAWAQGEKAPISLEKVAERVQGIVDGFLTDPSAISKYAKSVGMDVGPEDVQGGLMFVQMMMGIKLDSVGEMAAGVLKAKFAKFADEISPEERKSFAEQVSADVPRMIKDIENASVETLLAPSGVTISEEQAKRVQPQVDLLKQKAISLLKDFEATVHSDKPISMNSLVDAIIDDVAVTLDELIRAAVAEAA
jgi:hypothetical protein